MISRRPLVALFAASLFVSACGHHRPRKARTVVAESSSAEASAPSPGAPAASPGAPAVAGRPSPAASPRTTKGSAVAGRRGETGPAGTCAGSCTHYLQCKGVVDWSAQSQCLGNCASLGLTPTFMGNYERTDCPTAIFIVEGNGQQKGASGNSGNSKGSECNGCAWDGSSCIWLSQGNWGSGAYSGASSSCDEACCR